MVPITGRASSFVVVVFCMHVGKGGGGGGGGGETEQQQTYQFTQGYNILHRLQVHHLIITFIIQNKYILTLYLYAYIQILIIEYR